MAYSFRKMLFIGQNWKHVHMTYSFLELLIFFWLTLLFIVWNLFITTSKKYRIWIQISWETNPEVKTNIFTCFWYWCWKNLFLNVKLKLVIYFNFSQLHEHIFRSSCTQMFFKIGALKNFAILRIKKRFQHSCFPVRSNN